MGLSKVFASLVLAAATPAAGSTEKAETLGSCHVPVPQAFSCRSMPLWSSFLDNLQANALKGYPPDMALLREAEHIMSVFQEKPYPPQDFFKYLCDEQATWPPEDNFCLHGFVGALIIRSRHIMNSDSLEVRKEADMDFGYAATVLGKEGAVDFLDSSPWPVSILDAYININETNFMSYGQYALQHPVPAPRVPLQSIHWRPPSQDSLRQGKAIPSDILVAVVGTHATLSLEPVEMLRRFVNGVQIRPVFFGLEPRWCDILGMCNQGTAALGKLFKDSEKDPYAYPWDVMLDTIAKIYDSDVSLQQAQLLLCTEPLAGCLMLRQVAEARGKKLPLLAYLGVALLNSCPPEDLDTFWDSFATAIEPSVTGKPTAIMAVNNLILSEQIHWQSGFRMPYVRAMGLYTEMSYTPTRLNEILVWRAPLFMYTTTRCAMFRFLQGMPNNKMEYRFVEESENLPYAEVAQYKAVTLIPWDHALMTFYELYSAGIPLLLPSPEWMYRLLYQRGQLSVGERMYQSVMPGHTPPYAEFAEAESFKEASGPPNPATGMSSAKAARNVAEDMLTRGLESQDLDTAKQYLKAALELMQDQKYFLAVAENKTDQDSYTSMGVVRRATPKQNKNPAILSQRFASASAARAASSGGFVDPWHPYTPFQMSTRDSNDWTRMRKGGWWLRRGVRFDAMRYWYQFSDFSRFPGLTYFSNLPDLICKSQSLDVQAASEQMRRYNEQTLLHSATFWTYSIASLLAVGDEEGK